MRWHNGRTRHSENPYPEEVFQDCITNGEKSAAHSILARSYSANEGRIHLRRPICHSHFSLVQVTDFARGLTMRALIGTPRKTLLKDAEEAADLVLLPRRWDSRSE